MDTYSPKQIEARLEKSAVNKANLALVPMTALGVLAGASIGFGALFYTLVTADPFLGFASGRTEVVAPIGDNPHPVVEFAAEEFHADDVDP